LQFHLLGDCRAVASIAFVMKELQSPGAVKFAQTLGDAYNMRKHNDLLTVMVKEQRNDVVDKRLGMMPCSSHHREPIREAANDHRRCNDRARPHPDAPVQRLNEMELLLPGRDHEVIPPGRLALLVAVLVPRSATQPLRHQCHEEAPRGAGFVDDIGSQPHLVRRSNRWFVHSQISLTESQKGPLQKGASSENS
jgi:hypothetical protein